MYHCAVETDVSNPVELWFVISSKESTECSAAIRRHVEGVRLIRLLLVFTKVLFDSFRAAIEHLMVSLKN